MTNKVARTHKAAAVGSSDFSASVASSTGSGLSDYPASAVLSGCSFSASGADVLAVSSASLSPVPVPLTSSTWAGPAVSRTVPSADPATDSVVAAENSAGVLTSPIWAGAAMSSAPAEASLQFSRSPRFGFVHSKDSKMSTTQGRNGRSRAASAVVLLVAVVAAMLAQVAIADTASAAGARPMAAVAVQTTQVTIDHNNWTYDVGTVPISGAFTGNGRYVGGATIEIWTRPTTSVGSWTRIAVTRTNSVGRYIVNINATTTRYYQARFAGTYIWARSVSPVIRLNARRIDTRFVSTSPGNTTVPYKGGVDIRGIVVDIRGHRVIGQRVQLFGRLQGALSWVLKASSTTNTAGGYVFASRLQTYTIVYQVRLVASVKWSPSTSPAFWLTVGKLNTKVSASLLHPTITSGAGAMVIGALSDTLGRPLAGQRVEIWSKPANSASWAHLGSAVANSSGNYAYATHPLTTSSNFQTRYTATGIWNGSNSAVALQTVVAPPAVVTPPMSTPPATTTPVSTTATTPPVVTPPALTPGLPAGWVRNTQVATDTLAGVNAYRAEHGLPALMEFDPMTEYYGSASVDSCVLKNTTGTYCDPGNLAAGYNTGAAAIAAWKASPEHDSAMLAAEWTHISCAAYTDTNSDAGDIGCSFSF